jgi:hypothetical protein
LGNHRRVNPPLRRHRPGLRGGAGCHHAAEVPPPAGGSRFDRRLIAAPPSTKNRDRAGDPAMHQTKKSNQWHFGMKARIGEE